jgi:DNA-binding NarL/FixJ family response regulator
VLLADDDARMHRAISPMLAPSCDIVRCVADVPSLFEAVAQLRPDVVLLDLSLRGGIPAGEICRLITTKTPDVKVVVFSAYDDAEFRDHARECGASGYVTKLRAATDLLQTIHEVVDAAPPVADGERN